jgi:hypothetical protein
MRKIIIFISINLVIGNAIAWYMGAAPIDFPVMTYSAQEKSEIVLLKSELNEFKSDVALLTQLGGIYSSHNELDLAQVYLDKALALEPNNATSLAVSSANKAKQSGAMLDLSMGLYKIYTLWNACEGLNRAVEIEPNNFEVRTYRLAAFAAIGKINRYFDQVFIDEIWFKRFLENSSDNVPLELRQQFYLSMTSAYLHAGSKENISQAREYFKLFELGKLTPAFQDALVVNVKQRLVELS